MAWKLACVAAALSAMGIEGLQGFGGRGTKPRMARLPGVEPLRGERGFRIGVEGGSRPPRVPPLSMSAQEDSGSAFSRRNLVALGLGSVLGGILLPRVGSSRYMEGYSAPPFDPELKFLGPERTAFSLLPLAPGYRRKTVEEEVVPGQIWTHDQILGVVNVNVPVRQTVVRLPDGLLVYNPVAPTKELLKMMQRLEKQYGPVRHILLASTALEHKTTAALFSQRFNEATVWFEPGQWSFPVPLPISLEGFGSAASRGQLRPMPSPEQAPWRDVLDHRTLAPLVFKSVGTYSETAMFHKPSKTLLLTDAVVAVPKEPPAIIQEDPRALLYHARDSALDIVVDSPEVRRKGWRRMAQFGLVFFPARIDVSSVGQALTDVSRMDPRMKALGERAVPGGVYPWSWNDDSDFFQAGYTGGPFVPPILQKLIYDREPDRVYEWAKQVADWEFVRIVPCHLQGVIEAKPAEFLRAFAFLRGEKVEGVPQPDEADLSLLSNASKILARVGVTAPSLVDGSST